MIYVAHGGTGSFMLRDTDSGVHHPIPHMKFIILEGKKRLKIEIKRKTIYMVFGNVKL